MDSLVLFTLLFDGGLQMIEHISYLLIILILIYIIIKIFAIAKNYDFELLEWSEHA